jgi:hypothetical protein
MPSRTWISPPLIGSRELISIGTFSIGPIPSASSAHIASTTFAPSISTRWPRLVAEKG